MLAWKRFFELPGRDKSLFSPTFLDPSLMLVELEVKGSGAATLDSFYGYDKTSFEWRKNKRTDCFTLLADHDVGRLRVGRREQLTWKPKVTTALPRSLTQRIANLTWDLATEAHTPSFQTSTPSLRPITIK